MRMASGDGSSDALVEPGNVITRNTRLSGGTTGVVPERMPQMPAFHLVEPGYRGITMINIGTGPSNARTWPAQRQGVYVQEGYDPICEQALREIARLTRGAFCRFAPGAAHELAELLRAAAAYAAGGLKALADLKGHSAGVARLIEQLK